MVQILSTVVGELLNTGGFTSTKLTTKELIVV